MGAFVIVSLIFTPRCPRLAAVCRLVSGESGGSSNISRSYLGHVATWTGSEWREIWAGTRYKLRSLSQVRYASCSALAILEISSTIINSSKYWRKLILIWSRTSGKIGEETLGGEGAWQFICLDLSTHLWVMALIDLCPISSSIYKLPSELFASTRVMNYSSTGQEYLIGTRLAPLAFMIYLPTLGFSYFWNYSLNIMAEEFPYYQKRAIFLL